jgi:hypothetical protein
MSVPEVRVFYSTGIPVLERMRNSIPIVKTSRCPVEGNHWD